MSTQLNRAPDVQTISIAANDSAIALVMGQNTGKVTLNCAVDFRYSWRSTEGGAADATYGATVLADRFFEIEVDKGRLGDTLYVLVPAGSPANISIDSEP